MWGGNTTFFLCIFFYIDFDQSVYLWVCIDFLGVILIAVNVKPDGCPGTACPAETKDDTRTVSEDDPQTLKKHEDRKTGVMANIRCFGKYAKIPWNRERRLDEKFPRLFFWTVYLWDISNTMKVMMRLLCRHQYFHQRNQQISICHSTFIMYNKAVITAKNV